MRETHFLAIQFSQSDNTDGTHVNDSQDPQDLIPRLSKHEIKNLKLSELNPVNIVHFHGEKKPIPPCLNVTSGMEFEHLKKQENNVRQAFTRVKG